ncbi:unnamed protein product [Phytomonas sp. Hart1]|nr:unnamed protein product [Phytomonas sp. Hart1]|eukprot:CCW68336.1 unnamed protein product [Phytomonas sp. isolate Hart1]
MFPCELRDKRGIINRVIAATCGVDVATVMSVEPRSETSFVANVRTRVGNQLVQKLRCRVLMDRHGFWYANTFNQYKCLKEYCEAIRRLPQQSRHYLTGGLPCMPLVVELSRSVGRDSIPSDPAPCCFDAILPITTVDRHRSRNANRMNVSNVNNINNSNTNINSSGTGVKCHNGGNANALHN